MSCLCLPLSPHRVRAQQLRRFGCYWYLQECAVQNSLASIHFPTISSPIPLYNSKLPENNSNLQKKASYARRLSWQILYPMQRQTYKALLEVRIQQPYSSNLQLRKKNTKETHVRIWVSISGWSVHSSHINGLFTRHWDHSPHASICIHMLVLLKGLQSKVLS